MMHTCTTDHIRPCHRPPHTWVSNLLGDLGSSPWRNLSLVLAHPCKRLHQRLNVLRDRKKPYR